MVKIGKRLSLVTVLGLAAGLLASLGCGDDESAPVNHAPMLDPIGAQAVSFGKNLSFTATAIDPDGDNLTFFAVDLPSGAAFDETTQTFSWTPAPDVNPVKTYEVTFFVSDGKQNDTETISISVNRVKATGVSYSGIYPVFGYDFEGSCNVSCTTDVGMSGPPAPFCPYFTLIILQEDSAILAGSLREEDSPPLLVEGTIYDGGSFIAGGSFTFTVSDSPSTIQLTVAIAGDISSDKVGGNSYLELVAGITSCDWSFNLVGPAPASNFTVIVNGFTETDKHVYAFAGAEQVGIGAFGGGILADGSAEVPLKPELPNNLVMLLDVYIDMDGNVINSIKQDDEITSPGDYEARGIEFIIDGGGGSITLTKKDFSKVLPP